MEPTSEHIKDILVEEFESSDTQMVFGDNLFIGRLPTAPNTVVTIFDTPGEPPLLPMRKDEKYEYVSFQIFIRDSDYLEGWRLGEKVIKTLHGVSSEKRGDMIYTIIRQAGTLHLLEWDSNSRVIFSVNFVAQRRLNNNNNES